MTRRMRVLIVANKRLPANDYRVGYRRLSRLAEPVYALPGRPAGLAPHEFVPLGFGEGLGPRDVGCFWQLFRHLRQHRQEYDLVHFFSTKLQLFGPLVAKLAGVPCVATVTGYGRTYNRDELRYRMLRPLYLAAMRAALGPVRAVFFQNRGDMQWLADRFPGYAAKMHWVGSGADAEQVSQKDFRSSPLVVLMVARIMPDKGVAPFLDAARQLRGPDYRFVLVGPASVGQEDLLREVTRSHEEGVIDYRGELGERDLAALYRASHVFAFPSRGEGMPRVMLEAGLARMCPVASDIPAHRDLVAPDRGFLLDRTQEVASLTGHLAHLNAHRDVLERNACEYQRHIANHYSLAAYAHRFDELLGRLNLVGTPRRENRDADAERKAA